MKRLLVAAALLAASVASATVFTAPMGSFSALTTTPTSHSDSLLVDGFHTCWFQAVLSAGTGTIGLEASTDNGTSWGVIGSPATVTANGAIIDATANANEHSKPVGNIRPVTSACAGCNFVVKWRCVK